MYQMANEARQADENYRIQYDLKTKEFIEKFLSIKVPDNFREIIEQISPKSSAYKSLMDIYGSTIGITAFITNGDLDIFENENIALQERIK
jgi:hypothetical protein